MILAPSRTLLIQVLLSFHVLTMEPEIDWPKKIAQISESSLDTHIPPDITFKLNEDGVEHKVGAHKILMGMASPVFNKLLIKMGTLDNRTKELFVKGTTYGAFNIMKNAIYGMVPMRSSLKGKSVQEVFSIYDLVTRYQILELRQVVQNHLATFPLTDDTVLEVAADAKDQLLTFEEEARSLLARCAAYLKPKFKTVESVLEYFAEHTADKEILQELLVITRDSKDDKVSFAPTVVAIDCRKEPCHNEVGVVQNRGHSGGGDGQAFRDGRVYGGGRDGGGYNRGRYSGGYRESLGGGYRERGEGGGERREGLDNLVDYRGRDGGGYRESGRFNGERGGSGYRRSGDSRYGRGRDQDGYDDREHGGGGYGRVRDNRYSGDRRYGGGRNDGGYRDGGGYGRGREYSRYSGGNGYGQDERRYREETVYGGGRDDAGRDDALGGDIFSSGGSTDSVEYGGGERYNGGYRDSRDRYNGGYEDRRDRYNGGYEDTRDRYNANGGYRDSGDRYNSGYREGEFIKGD